MRGWLIGLLAMMAAPWALATDVPGDTPGAGPAEVVIAAEVWDAHTEADGTGLGWDVLRKVFEPVGVRLRIRPCPTPAHRPGEARRGGRLGRLLP